ncbi:regulatory protein [bacterium A37T11]|nr:regulatory protein [bacterium A37T11]
MNHEKKTRQVTLTPDQAKSKAESYCAYQDRSQQEVRDKLYSWGLHRADVENLISELIVDQFLSEERFAQAYVSGKFRMKQWGKVKIKQGLKTKSVPDKLIAQALASIDPSEYVATLKELLQKKAKTVHEANAYKRKAKLVNFALAKGYESDLIFDLLNDNDL